MDTMVHYSFAWRGMLRVHIVKGKKLRYNIGRVQLYRSYSIFFKRKHCSIFRSDGRGGGEGGCQRMEPELSWADNTNLTYAHKLLEPIKHKYGIGLSWGDLMVFAGTVAIEDMGGPVLGFAAGRIDHVDNSQTIGLGPSEEQDKFAHIEVDGQAPAPLGQNTMGLIYVNPAGPMGIPDPQGAADVRFYILLLILAN
jgi:catalase-peroxidase